MKGVFLSKTETFEEPDTPPEENLIYKSHTFLMKYFKHNLTDKLKMVLVQVEAQM